MKKKQHKPLFIDEKDFTLNAVIPWLRYSGFNDVTYVGGTDEFGRDVVCSRKEAGGAKSWIAVQVKDDDIKGNHQSAGIREIINQAKSAIENPFSLPGSREIYSISGVYIVTLWDITPNASTIIRTSTELQGRTVHFFNGETVVSNIKLSNAFVSRTRILLRTPLKENAVRSKAQTVLNGLKVEYYSHVSEDIEFDYDEYVDVSIEATYHELLTHTSKIQQLITELGDIMVAQVTLYYSKAYSKNQLDIAITRFLTGREFTVVERDECPCLLYNIKNSDWRWLENVDNLQILQEN